MHAASADLHEQIKVCPRLHTGSLVGQVGCLGSESELNKENSPPACLTQSGDTRGLRFSLLDQLQCHFRSLPRSEELADHSHPATCPRLSSCKEVRPYQKGFITGSILDSPL